MLALLVRTHTCTPKWSEPGMLSSYAETQHVLRRQSWRKWKTAMVEDAKTSLSLPAWHIALNNLWWFSSGISCDILTCKLRDTVETWLKYILTYYFFFYSIVSVIVLRTYHCTCKPSPFPRCRSHTGHMTAWCSPDTYWRGDPEDYQAGNTGKTR